ncbi:MAG: cyclophilin-like fold protein [Pseudomonadota bacterium]
MNRHLDRLLRHLPLALGVTTLALLLAGSSVWALGLLLFAWGALNAAIPVSWFNWLTQGVPDEPEAGGGLMVAAIQFAIMLGAGLGGLLLDHLSIVAPMLGGAGLLALGSLSVGSGRHLCHASPRPQCPDVWPASPARMGATQLALALPLAAAAADGQAAVGSTPPAHSPTASREQPRMWMTIGTRRFAVTLEDNPTERAFMQLLPMTLDMPDLNSNEKHVRLPRSLPTQAERPGTLRAGDVMLYGSSTLVVFYETFDSSHSNTRIGRMADSAGLARALGPGSARIAFTAPGCRQRSALGAWAVQDARPIQHGGR